MNIKSKLKSNLIEYVGIIAFLCYVVVMTPFVIYKEINRQDVSYNLMDFSSQMENVEIEAGGKRFFTTGVDAHMTLEFGARYVENVRIIFDEMPDKPWRLQVFYALGDESFSEERSIIYIVGPYEKKIEFELSKEVDRLRFDWGDETGNMFELDKITIY